jgi:hypothetical protein
MLAIVETDLIRSGVATWLVTAIIQAAIFLPKIFMET